MRMRSADGVFPGNRHWYETSYGKDSSATMYPYNGTAAFTGSPTYVLRYKLPTGLSCERCVLQWWYLTANSCTPPCDPADPNYDPANPARGCDKALMGICGESNNYPEVRWACCCRCCCCYDGRRLTSL